MLPSYLVAGCLAISILKVQDVSSDYQLSGILTAVPEASGCWVGALALVIVGCHQRHDLGRIRRLRLR
jgi:hypothetical protein